MKINKKFLLSGLLVVALTGCNNEDMPEEEDPGFRPATSASSPYLNKVYEYMPAPGQFINETVTGGFSGDETTMQDAVEYAERRLAAQKFVSLGSFGGYIVVGFDHSIKNSNGGSDFAIRGNALDTSNEPGIVYVMQDANRNGLPDDEWVELRGSETGKPGTISNYSVTYYRPSRPGMPVEWKDSEGNTGMVDYLKNYHKQESYYPAWAPENSYTLSGTRLEAKNQRDEATGFWYNYPYDWGYADNLGSDALAGNEHWVGFKISNAMKADGTPASLKYIDFVKVQQGVLAKSGQLGENSCEVLSVADYSLLFR